jgi:RNA polymerase sigma-70 factor (ECF subfamily)
MTTDPTSHDHAEVEQGPKPPSDPAAWLDLHGDALYRFARARVGRREVAEDLVQETFLAALQASDRFRGSSSPRTWLLAILRRKLADHYRRSPVASPLIETDLRMTKPRPSSQFFDDDGHWLDPPSTWKTPQESLEDDEFRNTFDDCVSNLPEHLARAFLLREVDGLETDRVRTVLDIGAANLRVRLHRARLLLRACLERHWFQSESGDVRSTRIP